MTPSAAGGHDAPSESGRSVEAERRYHGQHHRAPGAPGRGSCSGHGHRLRPVRLVQLVPIGVQPTPTRRPPPLPVDRRPGRGDREASCYDCPATRSVVVGDRRRPVLVARTARRGQSAAPRSTSPVGRPAVGGGDCARPSTADAAVPGHAHPPDAARRTPRSRRSCRLCCGRSPPTAARRRRLRLRAPALLGLTHLRLRGRRGDDHHRAAIPAIRPTRRSRSGPERRGRLRRSVDDMVRRGAQVTPAEQRPWARTSRGERGWRPAELRVSAPRGGREGPAPGRAARTERARPWRWTPSR